jgi:hypothetical protein
MVPKDLHDVIVDVLAKSKTPLTVRQITDKISEERLWYRPKDGKLPPASQVSARVNNYKHLFQRNGIVTLRSSTVVEERIARLTYNLNGWTFPSGPEGKSKAKTSYETKNGYGHEEWLFDFSKIIDGYHYGFLQPINANHAKYIGSTFNIHLYTVNSTTKEKLWIGKLNGVEVIDEITSKKIKAAYQKKGWFSEMKNELKDLKLDERTLDKWKGIYLFNVRFKPEDAEIYPKNTLIKDEDNSITSFHYVLLHVNEELLVVKEADGKFILGRCNPERRFSGKSIKKKIEERVIEYPFIHHELSRALEKTLRASFDEVYAEHDTGFRTSIDMVAVKDKKKNFYEIKTSSDIKACIRQSIGQLLEYCYYPDRQLADKIFIVTQHQIKDKKLSDYMTNIRARLELPIYYMWYDLKNKKIGEII